MKIFELQKLLAKQDKNAEIVFAQYDSDEPKGIVVEKWAHDMGDLIVITDRPDKLIDELEEENYSGLDKVYSVMGA